MTDPRIPLPTETFVMEGNDRILTFDGLLPLPIGARIQLDNYEEFALAPERFPKGHADAVVTGVRVWGTLGAGRALILEVQVVGVDEPPLPPM